MGAAWIWVFPHSSAATGPRVRTKTITMTDMKRSGLLIATPLHAGNRGGEAAGKTWARRPPGENKLSLMGKKSWVFLPPYTPHFYDHIISFPLWAAAGAAFLFFLFFCLQILAVGTLRRCTFGLWSLARRRGAPRLPLPRRWGRSQLVCEG